MALQPLLPVPLLRFERALPLLLLEELLVSSSSSSEGGLVLPLELDEVVAPDDEPLELAPASAAGGGQSVPIQMSAQVK